MAESTVAKTLRDGTLVVNDGTPVTPLTYTVSFENGDFSGTFPKADRVVIRDRHAVAGLRKGADPIPTFSFSVHMREFTDGSATTLVDVIEKTGNWAAAKTTSTAAFEQVLYDVVLTIAGISHDDTADHVLTLSDCHLQWDFSEGDPDSITVSGEVYGTVARTGPA